MKSGDSADRRDEALGRALREAADLAASGGEADFEAVYAAAELRGPVGRRGSAAARSGSIGSPAAPTPPRVAGRRLALALPLAAAVGLAIVAGMGEAARSRGFRDEIAFLSRRVVGPGMAASHSGPGGWMATEALYRVPAGEAGGAAGMAGALGAAGTPTELGLFVEGLWRQGPAAWGGFGEDYRAGDEASGDAGEGTAAAPGL